MRGQADDPWLDLARCRVEDTPALTVSAQRVARNVWRVADQTRLAGKMLRPHTKTHKTAEISGLQLQAGAQGLQVAKLGEALSAVCEATDDILIGFPLVGSAKLDRLARLAARKRVRVAADSFEVASRIDRALAGTGTRVGVMLDIETGMKRTGLAPEAVAAAAAAVQRMPNLELVGVMTHEGHISRQAADDAEMAELTSLAAIQLRRAADAVRGAGIEPLVSMGCTATWRFTVDEPGLHELRPGTYVFYDRNSILAGAASLSDVAAVVVTTVVSVSRVRGEFVIDAGSKALASERRELDAGVSFGWVPALGAEVVRLSEEHGIVAGAQWLPAIGDRVVVVPNHICPVVNLYDTMAVVDEGLDTQTWRVAARGALR